MTKSSLGLLILLASFVVVSGCNTLADTDDVGLYECDAYCNVMMDACPGTFRNIDLCYAACDEYPSNPQFEDDGDPIEFGAPVDNANSIECRMYHAETAARDSMRDGIHCPEAAPIGGGTCTDARGVCVDYCLAMLTNCPEVFEREADCEQSCQGLVMQFGEDGVECRALNAETAGEVTEPERPFFCMEAGPESLSCIGDGAGTVPPVD